MWWGNRTAALGRAFRLGLALALAGLTAACFQPLYADRPTGEEGGLRSALNGIEIDQIDAPKGSPQARVAVQLRNDLLFALNGGAAASPYPTHRLNIRMTTSTSAIIVDIATGRTVDEITGIDVVYRLTEIATKRVVVNGTSFARATSTIPGQQQRFALARARIDAQERAAKEIVDQIRTRLASYFVAGT